MRVEDIGLAAAAAGACAVAAGRLRWLTPDGVAAGWAIGTAVLGFGGWRWALVLATFVVPSSALTKLGRDRKTQPEHAGRGRDASQVLGTGGVAAAVAVLWAALADTAAGPALYAAFLGSLAAASADTWATEIGMLSRTPPRSLITRRAVPAGTSGGVTWLGSAAGAVGAGIVAAAGAWDNPPLLTAATLAGIVAMLFDSVLGAMTQASYRYRDGTVGEDRRDDGALIHGLAWMNNSTVNLVATLAGALLAAAIAR
ncbi:MAG: DUF92 domain-containing protein [Armatimonadota bacterium]|nr:DUF92 domain-containing protein [Armatimonadota bacterium]